MSYTASERAGLPGTGGFRVSYTIWLHTYSFPDSGSAFCLLIKVSGPVQPYQLECHREFYGLKPGASANTAIPKAANDMPSLYWVTHQNPSLSSHLFHGTILIRGGLLSAGIIHPSSSPASVGFFFVQKDRMSSQCLPSHLLVTLAQHPWRARIPKPHLSIKERDDNWQTSGISHWCGGDNANHSMSQRNSNFLVLSWE